MNYCDNRANRGNQSAEESLIIAIRLYIYLYGFIHIRFYITFIRFYI